MKEETKDNLKALAAGIAVTVFSAWLLWPQIPPQPKAAPSPVKEFFGPPKPPSPQEDYCLVVYVDTENGCQYLRACFRDGGLTPRMGADGKQICRKETPGYQK